MQLLWRVCQKNVGDAFLLSWRLDADGAAGRDSFAAGRLGGLALSGQSSSFRLGTLYDQLAKRSDKADRALLSVIKVCIALYNDEYFLDSMSDIARENLLQKLSKRKGPCVQMGFGLHAGNAVQGAIGSQRKIDPSYVSESVDRSETLESLTKRYGLKLLMSDAFHDILSPSNRRRCRKIDQLILDSGDSEVEDVDIMETSEIMELFTFDLDVDALHGQTSTREDATQRFVSDQESPKPRRSRRASLIRHPEKDKIMRRSSRRLSKCDDPVPLGAPPEGVFVPGDHDVEPTRTSRSLHPSPDLSQERKPVEFKLPTGPAIYNSSLWMNDEMRIMRKKYTDGLFYQTFNSGLNSYFGRDWESAKHCFSSVLERFDDGPSRYFLNIIEENDCNPPQGFTGYGSV